MTIMVNREVPCQRCGGLLPTSSRKGRWGNGKEPGSTGAAKCKRCDGRGRVSMRRRGSALLGEGELDH